MQNCVFVYYLKGSYRCLDPDEARSVGKKLIAEGWKHTSSIIPEVWLEYFLNGGDTARREAVKNLAG